MKKLAMHKTLISAALAAAMLLSLTACGAKDETPEETKAEGRAVEAETVELGDLSLESTVSGKVISGNSVSVYPGVTAEVKEIYVDVGDHVQAGQALCALDVQTYIDNLQTVEDNIATAQDNYNTTSATLASARDTYEKQKEILANSLKMAQDNYDNTCALFEIGAASQLEVDTAKNNLLSAQTSQSSTISSLEVGIMNYEATLRQIDATIGQLQASAATLRDNVAKGTVTAPVEGTVTAKNVVENAYASSSAPAFAVDEDNNMQVSVSVAESLLPKLSLGETVDVSIGALDMTVEGTVASIDPAAGMTQLYTVKVDLPGDLTGLVSGMFANVVFYTDTQTQVITVPTEAILTDEEGQYVFIVENGDTARRVDVTPGLAGKERTKIESGLSGGETLVTVGQAFLSDGDAVRIVEGE